jgi:hypothetical protein
MCASWRTHTPCACACALMANPLFQPPPPHSPQIALKNNFYMAPEMAAVHDMVLSEQCYQYGE